MKHSLLLYGFLALPFLLGNAWWFVTMAQTSALSEEHHTLTGDFQLHEKFASKFLLSDRDVIVYLPPDYLINPTRRYPVLYMHDGQNLFDGETAFIKGVEWRVDETAEALIRGGIIEPLIIVGIYNSRNRMDEYTPSRDSRLKMGGKADAYGRMIVEELKPFVDRLYRTLPDRENTALGGSSLGGLVSLHIALRHPRTFGRVAVISPSVWWDKGRIVQEVKDLRRKLPLKIWLDMGTNEGQNGRAQLLNARKLRDALLIKGWQPGEDLLYYEVPGGDHSERAWAQRFDMILRYLFPNT